MDLSLGFRVFSQNIYSVQMAIDSKPIKKAVVSFVRINPLNMSMDGVAWIRRKYQNI